VKFAERVLLMPVLAAVLFLGVLLVNEVTGRANTRLIEAIENDYVPALTVYRDAQAALLDTQRALQDAVTADDPLLLREADAHSRRLLEVLESGRPNKAFHLDEIPLVETSFAAYYDGARATSARLMSGESGDDLQPDIEKMSARYRSLRGTLEGSTRRIRDDMNVALQAALQNQRRSVRAMTVMLVLGLVALGLLSRSVVRSTVGALQSHLAEAAVLSGRAQAPGPGPVGGEDLDQIMLAMQDIMAVLTHSERRLNDAQRLAHVGSWEWNQASGRLTWSDEMQRIMGRTSTPTSVEDALQSAHADDRERVRADIDRALQDHLPFQHTLRVVRPDGVLRVVQASNQVLLDGKGEVVGLSGVLQDVTESEAAAEALRESEERYRALFQDNPQPMWVYAEDTLRFLAVNDAAIAHYGFTREEFLAMTVIGLHPPEGRALLEERDSPARARLQAPHGEWRHQARNGTPLEVEVVSYPVPFGDVRARLAISNDLTEKRLLESQLRQSQKMDAVGRLAGGVAHDFNNLLGVIMGYGEIVSRRLAVTDPLARKVSEIMRAAERAAGLTRQLLAFSRKQVLQPRVLDLNIVVADMDKMLRRLIGEDIELKTRLHEPLHTITADPGQMEQVIMNLAVNARDAMSGGGTLILETAEVDLDEAYARLHPGAQAGPYVMLAVSDTGQGMDASTLAQIFEPFFTTKPQGKGTGLGLSTVYGIVEQSGGHIGVYSEKGRGTTFKVYLPRMEMVAEAQPALPPLPPRGGSETVLLVEDEPALREMIRETLEQSGHQVLVGASPLQAEAIATSYPGPIHVMLTDVVMPEMSGRELAERMATLRPQTAVIYMSGYTDEAVGQHGLLDATTHFLQKPFSEGRLLTLLRQVLEEAARAPQRGTAAQPGLTAGRTRS
jgi:two-component system, cell cycle sensor histidine kinase and response regulator CckA